MDNHIQSNLPAEAHTAMYNWHKYWARKTWNVVSQYVEHYCPAGGIVLDPFSGSGVTAIESLRRGRRVIAIDLSPMANNILKATIMNTNLTELHNAYHKVKSQAQEKISNLYQTECRNCYKQIEYECMVWKDDKPHDVRYKCPECGDRQEKDCTLIPFDIELLNQIARMKIPFSYPNQPLYYPSGQPFKKRKNMITQGQLYKDWIG